ncbi:hypothetical protein I203_100154 [Kwoniella mangroviensis CBS 8507]|uniref:uncharacterized protein n=1 Tax=Kwoniella mangroviensis CBS 8507 TaxID=1296122 RepID=UPI00080D33EA|nr:uncharacterized protein I203_08059 [Kwoniella mangroviensis CBS 8507]OCF62836.1 hypothetical protein I203_08059 [Kwoniella mangroviensis CBS 8507]
MVQPQAGPSTALELDDYLCPLTTIRDTLLRSDPSTISIPKLRALLTWHNKKLSTPWSPFPSSSNESKSSISKPSFILPQTSITIQIDNSIKSLALRLSEISNIDEISSYLLIRSYQTFSLDEVDIEKEEDNDKILDRIILWYSEEILALPQIVLALLQLSTDGDSELGRLSNDLRIDIIGGEESSRYIEGLFRGFSNLAQLSLNDKQRGPNALFWATHQLRLQEQLLTLLFIVLYQTPNRLSNISEGLVRGTIMSSFGTSQSNREIWENDMECQRISIRIRDLMVIIGLESLCLNQIVSPVAENEAFETMLQNKEKIESIHQFMIDYSDDLIPHYPEPELSSTPLPIWPMSIICLAWAIILRSLPSDKAPLSGDGSVTWQDMAIRALRLPSGLFLWLEVILSGPLLEFTRDISVSGGEMDVGLFQRKVFKDLLIGLSELIQLENIADKPGLYRSWELLFGGGSTSTSSLIAADYWIADFPYDERRSMLDRSQFPYQPVHLLRVLSALVGSGQTETSSDAFGTDPAAQVQHYFTNLPTITHTVDPSWCKYVGKDENGKEIVEAVNTLILPGGASIPKGSRGFILPTTSSSQVMWINQIISGWPLLLEILEAAAGLKSAEERAPADSANPPDSVYLSVRDLDIQLDTSEILAAGIKFLHSVLQSSSYVKSTVLTHLNPDDHLTSGQTLLHLALTVLQHSRNNELTLNSSVVPNAIDIIQSLITSPESNVWPALRSSGFFDVTGKKRGSVIALVQADSVKGEHILTAAVLRLVHTLIVNADHVPDSDVVILRSAIHFVFADIWNNFSAWRYKDVAKKYELSSLLVGIFDTVLSHPLSADGSGPTPAAQVLIDLFITSTSPLTYRPLLDAITQASYLVPRLIGFRRHVDAELVVGCLDETLSFLGTLFRISSMIGTSPIALPASLVAIPVAVPSGDKVQLVDALFEIAFSPAAQTSNVLNILKTLRVYLEVIGQDPHKPSLASMLRSPTQTCENLTDLATRTDDPDVRATVWDLLSTIVSTQPGCVLACIGLVNGEGFEGTLKYAVEEITSWETTFREAPHTLSAVLNYLQSIMRAAGADKAICHLRKNSDFWQAIFDLSTRIVPAPPSFSLSMHSEDFTSRIQKYAYSVQAKANATSLLSSELSYALNNDLEEDGKDPIETKARTLVLSLFRNNSALQETTLMSCHNSCVPELHEDQSKKIIANGGNLGKLKTIKLASEREYGRSYLYDGSVIVQGSATQQSTVNLALDLLNLNWSMLDADICLTRSFRLLAESISPWIEGDNLAINAALRAGVAIAETVAEEYRGGDVMLAIQVDRLSILAVISETALDVEEQQQPDAQLLRQFSSFMAMIVNSQSFPPVVSLRHSELPAIHQPVLRILYLLLQAMSTSDITASNLTSRESLVDAATIFALESADIVFDSIIRRHKPAFIGNLSMIIGVLCELSKLASTNGNVLWLDKVQGFNLIGRSLEVLVRTKITNDQLPLHISSILLLHLALASNPLTAEKLAISGTLAAYSDNVIVVQAEHGKIAVPTSSTGNSTHDAWCGMLLVIKALLFTLPDTTSFVRTDVIPFIRVVNQQLLRSMSWDGESTLSLPALNELELVTDIFYGLVSSLGQSSIVAEDYSIHAVGLLKNIRYSLSHPRLLSTLLIPSTEDERLDLEKELESIEQDDQAGKGTLNLFDSDRTPILASRSLGLLRVVRTIISTFIGLTNAWEVFKDDNLDDRAELNKLVLDQDEGDENNDPVEILNDLYTIISNIPLTSSETISKIQIQILESISLVSFTQLLIRHALLPDNEKRSFNGDEDDGQKSQYSYEMDLDLPDRSRRSAGARGSRSSGGRRRSSSMGRSGSKESLVLRELQDDLKGLIGGESNGMRGFIRTRMDRVFGSDN